MCPCVVPTVFYNYSTFGRWQVFGLLLTSTVYYICYNGMVDAARMGVSGGTYFDILAVCLTAQAVNSFSKYGWYIYLLVRVRIAYHKVSFYTWYPGRQYQ